MESAGQSMLFCCCCAMCAPFFRPSLLRHLARTVARSMLETCARSSAIAWIGQGPRMRPCLRQGWVINAARRGAALRRFCGVRRIGLRGKGGAACTPIQQASRLLTHPHTHYSNTQVYYVDR